MVRFSKLWLTVCGPPSAQRCHRYWYSVKMFKPCPATSLKAVNKRRERERAGSIFHVLVDSERCGVGFSQISYPFIRRLWGQTPPASRNRILMMAKMSSIFQLVGQRKLLKQGWGCLMERVNWTRIWNFSLSAVVSLRKAPSFRLTFLCHDFLNFLPQLS